MYRLEQIVCGKPVFRNLGCEDRGPSYSSVLYLISSYVASLSPVAILMYHRAEVRIKVAGLSKTTWTSAWDVACSALGNMPTSTNSSAQSNE